MSCNFCKHIKKQGMSQYCSKRNGKEIIYDQSNTCDYYEPLENAPSWVNKIKSAHHSASDQLHKVTEQRDRLAEALQLFLNRVQYNSVFMDGKLRGGTFNYRSSGFDDEVTQAYEALAAVKGDKV